MIILTSYKKRLMVPAKLVNVEETGLGVTVRVGLNEFKVQETFDEIMSLLEAAGVTVYQLSEVNDEDGI